MRKKEISNSFTGSLRKELVIYNLPCKGCIQWHWPRTRAGSSLPVFPAFLPSTLVCFNHPSAPSQATLSWIKQSWERSSSHYPGFKLRHVEAAFHIVPKAAVAALFWCGLCIVVWNFLIRNWLDNYEKKCFRGSRSVAGILALSMRVDFPVHLWSSSSLQCIFFLQIA